MSEAAGSEQRSSDERGWDQFAPLYDEHHERLYRVALLLCHGDEVAAQDAVTETFLRLFEQWKMDRVDNFFSAARQVLVQEVLGRYRDGDPHRPTVAEPRDERPVDDSINDAASTFQLLEQLEPTDRTAVVLRYFEDLSYDQIASTMGVTSGTAKAQVSVGLAHMRSMMDGGE